LKWVLYIFEVRLVLGQQGLLVFWGYDQACFVVNHNFVAAVDVGNY